MPLDPKQCPKCGSTSITMDDEEAGHIALQFPEGWRPPGDAGLLKTQHWTCTCGHDWTVTDAN